MANESEYNMNAAPGTKRMRQANAPVPTHVAERAAQQRAAWAETQGYIPNAQIFSATLNCGHVKPFAEALYAEFPKMVDCTKVISAAGKVRVSTTAAVDVLQVEAFVCDYAERLAEGQRIAQRSHEAWMAQDHLKEKFYRAVERRRRTVQQVNRLRMGR